MIGEYDENLLTEYNREVENIPKFFRLNKKSIRIAGIIGVLAILVAISSIVKWIVLFLDESKVNELTGFERFNYFLNYAHSFYSLIPVGLVVAWYVYARYRDRQAFLKASRYASMCDQYEKQQFRREVTEVLTRKRDEY